MRASRLSVALLLCLTCGVAVAAEAPGTRPAQRAQPARRVSRPLPPAPPGVVIEQNLAYLAPGRTEKLDLYLPADRAKDVRSPAVVMIHGGGWVGGDKAAPREFQIGTTLAQNGYVAISINYRLEEKDRWPTNLFDCKNAVRFLRASADKYGVDPERIGVMGGSAGGHLSLMVAYTSGVAELTPTGEQTPYPGVSDRVSCVINLYGVADPRTRQRRDKSGEPIAGTVRSAALLPGTTPQSHPGEWRLTAPVEHATKESPPTMTLHGKADETVHYDQALQLDEKLKSLGVEHRMILLDGIGHTFDLVSWRGKPLPQDLRPVVLEFFGRHLRHTP